MEVQWPGSNAEVKIFKAIVEEDSDAGDEDEDDENDNEDGKKATAGSGFAVSVKAAGELEEELGGPGKVVQLGDLDLSKFFGGGGPGNGEEGEEEVTYEEAACTSFSAEKVFVGHSPEHGAKFDGNSMLLHLEGLKYVFVGEEVFSFTAKSPITKFLSPVGNNDVPYPWAVDEEGSRYLFTMSVILASKLFENSDEDPCDLFIDEALITADIGTVPPTQPKTQFQGITEWWIGEEQFTMRYAEDPEADYDRLAGQLGAFSVVKDGAKIPLSKADYVKLMQDFAEEKGFQPLHRETLVERQI